MGGGLVALVHQRGESLPGQRHHMGDSVIDDRLPFGLIGPQQGLAEHGAHLILPGCADRVLDSGRPEELHRARIEAARFGMP